MSVPKYKRFAIKFFIALFGWRAEFEMVPFQFARPQIALANWIGERRKSPSMKAGPFYIWTMPTDKLFEIGVDCDFDAHFHKMPFARTHDGSWVWPDFTPKPPQATFKD